MPKKNEEQAQPENQPKKEAFTSKDFETAYVALCEKMGWRIVFRLGYKFRDDNTFSTVVDTLYEPVRK